MTHTKIAIIGAGMAGLACARALQKAGLTPIVFDKGRGVGGRLATRRNGSGLSFDHGAQFVTARSGSFTEALADLAISGFAAPWDTGAGQRVVGQPGMSALARGLAVGLDIRLETPVSAVLETSHGVQISAGPQTIEAEHLVITAPPAQTAELLGADHPLSRSARHVLMAPCWTLMAAFAPDQPRPFISRRDEQDPLEWIALNSSKPGRTGDACWIAQASPGWSAEHLEEDAEDSAPALLALLCERLGTDPGAATHVAAHRWRYARVLEPLGQPYLRNEAGTLYLGGDWCLDARVEAAWTSGTAIASALLKDLFPNGS